MNDINDDIRDALLTVLRRTNDDFGVTLSGNPLSKEAIEYLHSVLLDQHKQKVQQ